MSNGSVTDILVSMCIFDNTKLHLVYYFRCLFKDLIEKCWLVLMSRPVRNSRIGAEFRDHVPVLGSEPFRSFNFLK